MANNAVQIYEYRGVDMPVYAKVLSDDSNGITYGEVKEFAGVSEISRETESSSEAHYYNNVPAVVVDSTGSDTVTINSSAIPLDIVAEITGQYYDETTGMFVEQERTPGYFAFGYRTQKTDGTEVLVWRNKGTFSIPSTTNTTQDSSTDANGQELTYTGISTAAKSTKTGKPFKAVNVDTSVNPVDADTFLGTVQTPDTVQAASTYSVIGVGVAPSSDSIEVGETIELTATVYPANASNQSVTWASSDEAVATVDANGNVTGVAEGSATITATTVDGGKTDTCAITVTAAS